MSARLKRNWLFLRALKTATPKQRKAIIRAGGKDLVLAICEIVDNLLRGTVTLSAGQRKKLQRYKKILREIANRKVGVRKKTNHLVQRGGFLSALLAPTLGIIASLIGEAISK